MKVRATSTYRAARAAASLCMAFAVLPAGLATAGQADMAGKYLYANPPESEISRWKGSLTIVFKTPGDRLVVAWGRRWRKTRKSRKGTTEAEREKFKPWKAQLRDGGRVAVFPHLPPDYYDLIVIEPETMQLYEGLQLMLGSDPNAWSPKLFEEVKKSLTVKPHRVGGWEAFFDAKRFDRFETDGERGAVLVQQMRLKKALTEAGDVIRGCIHSIDVCWLERARVEGAGWQVINRQQLYRGLLPQREFFTHHFVKELRGVRVGMRPRKIGPIALPR